MTAVVTPPSTTPVPEPAAADAPELIRVFANLLPDEVIAARRLSKLKRRLALGMAGLVVVLALAFGYSWTQTNNAEGDLGAAQDQTLAMTAQLQKYAPVVTAQSSITQIQSQLRTIMAGDLQWSKLIATLTSSAPGKLALTAIAGTVNAPGQAGGSTDSLNPLNTSGLQLVGTLTLSGTTPDYRSVATYVETLSKVKGLAVVDPGLVSGNPGSLTFTITLSLTTESLGGRFSAPTTAAPAPASAPTGGK
jgi:Tfp pilus assembly protein PilN